MSPQSPTNGEPGISAWRWAVSLLVFVIGAIYSLALPALLAAVVYSGDYTVFDDWLGVTLVSLTSATGVGAIWLGLRILRRKRPQRRTAD